MAKRNDDNDLHIKMCKKIAQITKVVFHLNTKVSENQKTIYESKAEHDENVKCLTESFNVKIAKYEQQLAQQQKEAIQCDFDKTKLENQYMHKKLNELQEANDFYKVQLNRSSEEKIVFQDQLLKEKLEKEELKKELIFDLKNNMHISLEKNELQFQEELKTVKSLFEKTLSQMDNKNRFLETENKIKMEEIDFFKTNFNNLNIQVEDLEGKKLELEFEILKLTESYDTKTKELNLCFENELNMLKAKYVQDNENFQLNEKSRLHDLECKVLNLQKNISILECTLSTKEKEMEDLKIEYTFLQDSFRTKNIVLSQMIDELEKNKQCISVLNENIKISEIVKIANLDETRLALTNLERERDNALMQVSNKNGAITDLEMALKHVNTEMNKRLKEFKDLHDTDSILLEENKIYRKTIEDEKASSLMYTELYKSNFISKEEEIKELRSELCSIKVIHSSDILNLEKKFKEDLVLEKTRYSNSVDSLVSEHEKQLVSIKNDVAVELNHQNILIEEKENTIMFLKASIEKHIDCNSSLNSQIAGYKEFIHCCVNTEKRLSEEVLATKQKLFVSENKNIYLEKCVTDIKSIEQKQMILWEEEKKDLQSCCKNLNNEKLSIEKEWQKILDNEILKWKLKLKSLEENKEQNLSKEKQALHLLTEDKEQEIFILKEQISQLNAVISRQQNQLSLTLLEHQKTIEMLKKNSEEEKIDIENKSRLNVTLMVSTHSKEIEDIKLNCVKDKEIEISALNEKFETMILEINNKNQLSFDVLKCNLESQNKKAVVELKKSFEKEKVFLQSSLHLQYEDEIKKHLEDFDNKFITCKNKLIHSEELRNKELSANNKKVSDLLDQVNQEKEQVKAFSLKMANMADEAVDIRNEIYLKGQEVLDVRRECNLQTRERLENLTMKHNVYVNEIKAKYAYELKLIADEYSEKNLKFEKEIQCLQLKLENANSMFQKRPSRKEDIDLMDELKKCVFEQEIETRKLSKEREYFRLELINRDQNFNKLFNSSPHVGVIDPIARKQSVHKK